MPPLNRLIGFLIVLCFPSGAWAVDDKPNIVFVLCDDLGIGDLGCYGQQKLETPNIDAIAANGIKFNNHYSGSTVCAPSRSSLMTGQHTGHTYVRGNSSSLGKNIRRPKFGQYPFPANITTLPKLLKEAGYITGMFGKWGLGAADNSGATNRQGFDEFFGYYCQGRAHSYYPAYLWKNSERVKLDGNTYSHDLIWNEGEHFIREQAESAKPFFAYLSIAVPHASMSAPQNLHQKWCEIYPEFNETIGKYGGRDMGKDRATVNPIAGFAAMMENLDNQVGELVAELKSLGIYENTMLVFTSDNGAHKEGGHKPQFWNSSGPFQGYKRALYEGGIHVPLLVSWPSRIAKGQETDNITAFWDWLPTLCEVAGATIPEQTQIDGISMVPLLTGNSQQQQKHEFLYWEFTEGVPRKALREGKWKLILSFDADGITVTKTELFDLEKDQGEQNNLATTYPKKARGLLALIDSSHSPSDLYPFKGRSPKKK